jgi:hypothetical protein
MSLPFIRAMALETSVGQNGPYVAVELNRIVVRRPTCFGAVQENQDEGKKEPYHGCPFGDAKIRAPMNFSSVLGRLSQGRLSLGSHNATATKGVEG